MGQHALVYEGSRADLRLPRPGAAALPLLALAAASLVLDAAPGLPWTVGVAVAGLFLAAACALALQRTVELHRLRQTADRLILRDDVRLASSPFLEWRAEQLTSERRRRALARSLRHVVHELDPAVLPGASPLNRRAVRPYCDRLAELARLLDDRACGVTARGVLLVESLLTDPGGPLYDRDHADRLEPALARAARTLAGGTPARRSSV